jgi:hypothetical protein
MNGLERSSLRQCVERLHELVYSRLIGSGKAFGVAPARFADGNPPSLRVNEIGPLTHGNERRQDFEERGQACLVLAERVGFADRRFGGCRDLRAIERRVGGGVTRARREAEDRSNQDAEPFAKTKFHGAVLSRENRIRKIGNAVYIGMLRIGLASEFGVGGRGCLPMRRRHRAPGRLQCAGAGGVGAADIRWAGAAGHARTGSLRRRWKVRQ